MNDVSLNPVEKKVARMLSPFEKFIESQTSTGLLLAGATCLAMVFANSDMNRMYREVILTDVGLLVGSSQFTMSLEEWVGSGFMALFFFLLGLELKRECLAGEMQNPRQIGIVLSAALGGMVLPALIYYLTNLDSGYQQGWAIAMATDTAFALGALAFFARKVSRELFVFLTGLAIFDDLGAITVIAVYYTESLHLEALLRAGAVLVLLIGMNISGVRAAWAYFILGLVLWMFVHESGVHATVAGVLVALTIPARPSLQSGRFVQRVRKLISKFERRQESENEVLSDQKQSGLMLNIEEVARQASTPLQRWETKLENPIALVVLPVFALCSAGIRLSDQDLGSVLSSFVSLGIIGGLVVGKPLGIFLFSKAAVKLGLGSLPEGMGNKELLGVGLLAGMGFTMSIFIAMLAFKGQPLLIEEAKLAILISTFLSGLLGILWLALATRNRIDSN
ncbi:MAG: Na+/H+ antiporter NhaA [Candidatus Nitrohelix vancouverensis]|uniref:Na(+)/H(+) antiporter NhaA n=1 Tax=Candidatus Nitrohelix vancouverensis TaxID=2705534 RepID=A0A7T0G3H9_9BACT|nr:MAG: Na+/H+ antiporter NhaA [Candidatus Nitrohelix vancouverensis]